MGDRLGTPGAANKTKALQQRVSQADGQQILSRLWESLDCVPDSLLATAAKQSPHAVFDLES